MKKGKKTIILYGFLIMLILASLGCPVPAPDDDEPIGDEVWALFPDINLCTLIKQKFADPAQVKLSDLATITELNNSESEAGGNFLNILSLGGIQNLKSLGILNLCGNSVKDISLLGQLTALTELDLSDTQITAAGGSNLEPLSTLTALRTLSVMNVPDLDTTVLAGLTNLEKLNLFCTGLTDISFLEGLTKLTELDLGMCDLSSAQTNILGGLTNLVKLYLSATGLTDIGFITGLTNLSELDLGNCNVRALQPLLDNPGIGTGDIISLIGNPTDAFTEAELAAGEIGAIYYGDITSLVGEGVDVYY